MISDLNQEDDWELNAQVSWRDQRFPSGTLTNMGTIRFSPQEPAKTNGFSPLYTVFRANQQAYYIQNALSLLDSEGEWYYDKISEILYYKPLGGEDISIAEIIIPQIETLFNFTDADNIRISGMEFVHTAFDHRKKLTPDDNYHSGDFYMFFRSGLYKSTYEEQNDILWNLLPISGSVSLKDTENIVIEESNFKYLGGIGVALRSGTRKTIISRNDFRRISGNAISINQLHTISPWVDTRHSVMDTISNNYVDSVAEDYIGCSGIGGPYIKNVLIYSNEIYNVPYSGIALGLGWSDSEHLINYQKENYVGYNIIDSAVNTMNDGAGIYLMSYMNNTLVERNVIKNILYSEWMSAVPLYKTAHGIYLDNGAREITVTENVLINIQDPDPIWEQSHVEPYAYDNDIFNNYIEVSSPPENIVNNAGIEPYPTRTLYGDYDGDGITDTLEIFQSFLSWRVLSEGKWQRREWFSGWGAGDIELVGDFNGDGYSDVLLVYYYASEWRWGLLKSTGSSFTGFANSLIGYDYGNEICAADYDSDGSYEVIIEDTQNYCAELNGDSFDIQTCSRDCQTVYCSPSVEICDGLDNDCDGQSDNGLSGCNYSFFVSQTVPTEMTIGESYEVSVTMRNTGSTTWTMADEYKLGSQNPIDNNNWSIGRILLESGESIANGQEKTFTFTVTPPSIPGICDFQWRMLRESIQWFGEYSDNVEVMVSEASLCDSCLPTEECCNDQCVDIDLDINNCGSCGNICNNADQCTIDVCSIGDCIIRNRPTGTSCDDGLTCTENDGCDGLGECIGQEIECGLMETCGMRFCMCKC